MVDQTLQSCERVAPLPVASPVELAILKTVAYADVFDYPLTAGEVHRYLVGLSLSARLVSARLARLAAAGRLHCRGGHYTLRGRGALVEVRRARERVAARLWPEAIRYGRTLAQLPYVRMVAVTGSLAVDNPGPDGDIDYLVVTVAGRVWIGRAMASLLRRRARLRGVELCPNYVLSERSLAIPERNLYTAHEIVQMVPVAGLEVYRRMLETNAWTGDFLPNFRGRHAQPLVADLPRRPLARVAEAVLRTPVGSALDRLERARLRRKATARAESLAEAVYSEECCKDHVHPHGGRILAAFAERFAAAVGARS